MYRIDDTVSPMRVRLGCLIPVFVGTALLGCVSSGGDEGGSGGARASGGAIATGGMTGTGGTGSGSGGSSSGDASVGDVGSPADLVFADLPPPGVVRVVLRGISSGPGQGYAIGTNMVVEDGSSNTAADFFLSLKMIASLAGTPAGGGTEFCRKGMRFTSPLDVPLDASGCSWEVAQLGFGAPQPQSNAAGLGFLARGRDGNLAARLVIVEHQISQDGRGEVTFDLTRAGLM
jgi:hypothetical protein